MSALTLLRHLFLFVPVLVGVLAFSTMLLLQFSLLSKLKCKNQMRSNMEWVSESVNWGQLSGRSQINIVPKMSAFNSHTDRKTTWFPSQVNV